MESEKTSSALEELFEILFLTSRPLQRPLFLIFMFFILLFYLFLGYGMFRGGKFGMQEWEVIIGISFLNIPALNLCICRSIDAGKSPWWGFIAQIPGLNIILFLVLALLPSQPSLNWNLASPNNVPEYSDKIWIKKRETSLMLFTLSYLLILELIWISKIGLGVMAISIPFIVGVLSGYSLSDKGHYALGPALLKGALIFITIIILFSFATNPYTFFFLPIIIIILLIGVPSGRAIAKNWWPKAITHSKDENSILTYGVISITGIILFFIVWSFGKSGNPLEIKEVNIWAKDFKSRSYHFEIPRGYLSAPDFRSEQSNDYILRIWAPFPNVLEYAQNKEKENTPKANNKSQNLIRISVEHTFYPDPPRLESGVDPRNDNGRYRLNNVQRMGGYKEDPLVETIESSENVIKLVRDKTRSAAIYVVTHEDNRVSLANCWSSEGCDVSTTWAGELTIRYKIKRKHMSNIVELDQTIEELIDSFKPTLILKEE
jgi:hypothetical protein